MYYANDLFSTEKNAIAEVHCIHLNVFIFFFCLCVTLSVCNNCAIE